MNNRMNYKAHGTIRSEVQLMISVRNGQRFAINNKIDLASNDCNEQV